MRVSVVSLLRNELGDDMKQNFNIKFRVFAFYCRVYQAIFRMVLRFVVIRIPKHMEGVGVCIKLPGYLARKKIRRVLIVSSPSVLRMELVQQFLAKFEKYRMSYVIYEGTKPNPTISNVEDAYQRYIQGGCEAIVAIGGGSVMDCAKGVAIRVVKPKQKLSHFAGVMKVRCKLPPLYAIPTTAGTGSEVTVAAVISDPDTSTKFEILDPSLVPKHVVLDAELTRGLPPILTATTGMDALAHAVEAYIGQSNTKVSVDAAKKAVRLIHENLDTAYQEGNQMDARMNMLRASHYAGVAFTRAYVGYVHALAHAVGGLYGLGHGWVIAIILPYVLEFYMEKALVSGGGPRVSYILKSKKRSSVKFMDEKSEGDYLSSKLIKKEQDYVQKLAELSVYAKIAKPEESVIKQAKMFITWIRELNEKMEIPTNIQVLFEEDIDEIVEMAYQEANPLYPVPIVLSRAELREIMLKML